MPHLLLTLLVVASGLACHYEPGEMERVAAVRHISLHGYQGGVALKSASYLGRVVWIRRPDGVVEGPFRVVDCFCGPPWCPDGPYPPRGWAVDVDDQTWAGWIGLRQESGSGPLPGVTVLYDPAWVPGSRFPGWSGVWREYQQGVLP